MKTHCRCSRCQTRRVLARHPLSYVVQPRCANCGARDWRPDKWMNERNSKAMTCRGECMHYPHRRGSRGCWYQANGEWKPNEQILEEQGHDQEL